MLELIIDIDKQLFLFLNGFHSSFWDTSMFLISAKWVWATLSFLLVGLLIKRVGFKSTGIALVFVFLALLMSDLGSVHLFKNVFQRLRPCHDLDLTGLVHIVKNKCGGQYGFISSHASNTFMVAAFFSLSLKNIFITLFLLFWAAVVSYSRIYLGVHFPLDIIGGAIWGVLAGSGFYYIYFQTSKVINKLR